jgi:hypothetical protein
VLLVLLIPRVWVQGFQCNSPCCRGHRQLVRPTHCMAESLQQSGGSRQRRVSALRSASISGFRRYRGKTARTRSHESSTTRRRHGSVSGAVVFPAPVSAAVVVVVVAGCESEASAFRVEGAHSAGLRYASRSDNSSGSGSAMSRSTARQERARSRSLSPPVCVLSCRGRPLAAAESALVLRALSGCCCFCWCCWCCSCC